MHNWKERTELLLGKDDLEKLENANCLIAGLGGVGAYAAEMLVRAGLGNISIVDFDIVKASNINRQLIALHSTVNQKKIKLLADRLKDINPDLNLEIIDDFIKDEKIDKLLDNNEYDYILDAIDTLSPKIYLIKSALERNIKIISSMGAGGKKDPSQIRVSDFSETYNDKLARMLRKRMHKMNIYSGFKVVFTPEKIDKSAVKLITNEQNKKTTVGTISYMPPMFGMFMAAEVIRDLCE